MCDDALHHAYEQQLKTRGSIQAAGVYLRESDTVRLSVYSSVASQVVTFHWLVLNDHGDLQPGAEAVLPTADRAATSKTLKLGQGFLVALSARLSTGNANRGQTYVRAQVLMGSGSAAIPIHTLLGGYVADDYSPTYPNGKIEGPLEGAGHIHVVSVATPAAGAEWTQTVPTGARWRVHSGTARFTTSADAANRQVGIEVVSGSNLLYRALKNSAATAGVDWDVIYNNPGFDSGSFGTYWPAPWTITGPLVAGWILRSTTLGIDDTDAYTAVRLLVEEWIEA